MADLAVVSVIPSPLNMWAAVGIREASANIETINEKLKSASRSANSNPTRRRLKRL